MAAFSKKINREVNVIPDNKKNNPVHKRWVLIATPILFSLVLMLLVFALTPALRPGIAAQFQGGKAPDPKVLSHPVKIQLLNQDNQQAVQTARNYMSAFIKGQYDVMWSALHPQIQNTWSGETAFAAFLKARFQNFTLLQFTVGNIQDLPLWVNPETMQTYSQVKKVYVSLDIVPSTTLVHLPQAQLLPEDLHPGQLFKNLPIVLQKVTKPTTATDQWLILSGGPADPEAPILPPVNPTISTVQVPILMYHHISDLPTYTVLARSLTVTSQMFNDQLDYLKQRNYHSITFNQLFNALYFGGPLPIHPVILTFDDGYDDAYNVAFPILRAHGFSGMFYIITGKVGWHGQMNWAQLNFMLNAGMQMGSHTIHHVDMGQLVLAQPDRAQLELQQPKIRKTHNTGIIIQQFCCVGCVWVGGGTFAEKQAIIKMLSADEYIGATTDPGATGTYQQSVSPFVLLRVRVDGRQSLKGFDLSMPW